MSITIRTDSRSEAEPPPSVGWKSIQDFMRPMFFIPVVAGFTGGFWYPLLPAWSDATHINAASLNFLNSISFLAMVVMVPIFSALGDRYGHRRLLTMTISLTAIGFVLITVAPGFAVAAIGNSLWSAQSASIGLLIGLVRDKEKGARANRTIALLATGITVGSLIGVQSAGPIMSLFGGNARLPLLVPAILLVVCALISQFLLSESTTRADRPIDWIGSIGLSVGLVSLLVGVMNANSAGWTSLSTLGLSAIGLVVLVAWVKWERRTPAPLINLDVVTSRAMWPAMLAAAMFGAILYVPKTPVLTFLAAKPESVGYGFGFAATAISIVLTCFYLMDILGSSVYALIAGKIGARGVLVAGIGCGTVGLASTAILAHAGSTAWAFTLGFMTIGLGTGLLHGSMPAYISEAAPADQVAVISGTYFTVRGVGGTIGTAMAGAMLAAFTPAHATSPTETGYSAVWLFCAAASVVSLLLMILSWFRRR
ncbi:MFS transporter, partial [Nocardia sp. NPDC059154]